MSHDTCYSYTVNNNTIFLCLLGSLVCSSTLVGTCTIDTALLTFLLFAFGFLFAPDCAVWFELEALQAVIIGL